MDAQKALDVSAERIAREFEVSTPEVRAKLSRACDEFANARIQDFVPVFAERHVREQLRSHVGHQAPRGVRPQRLAS